jgi:3-methyladenine DNA glycosylase/8-oxoguanine DNA glycosylase
MKEIFTYGEKEVSYLRRVDPALGAVMEQLGPIERGVIPDLFAALVSSIVAQQISTKAAETVWQRLLAYCEGEVTPQRIAAASVEGIQQQGLSMRKATYIKEAAEKVLSGELDINALEALSDEEVCERLSALKGIGVWTAEMLMTFSLQRPNILSFGDLAIHRGLRMLHRHRAIDKKLFEKYRRRYAPYNTVAALYLWALAGGACGLTDPAPKKAKG